MIVDDNEINRRLLEILAQQFGCDFVSVSDGGQALEKLRQMPFDLVLLDVMMPVMDGVTALRRWRVEEMAFGEGRRTPVLFVTAHAMTGDAERFTAEGADGYLSKPISRQTLRREMIRVLGCHA